VNTNNLEKHVRTILKTITWRIVASIVVFVSVYHYSKDINLAITSGAVAAIIKTILYYIHERLWAKTAYGVDVNRLNKMHKDLKKKKKKLKKK
jgi:uncharacterized membrane protein